MQTKRSILIFEDNQNMLSSVLLKKYSYNSADIHFANCNSLLFRKLLSLYNTEDLFYVIVDFVPNNSSLKGLFSKLRKHVRDIKNYSNNVFLVPTLCMESAILKTLVCYGYISLDEVVRKATIDFDYGWLVETFYKSKNLEKVYKTILNNYLLGYFKNVSTDSQQHEVIGAFYKQDSLGYKAEQLYSCLPVSPIVSQSHKNYVDFCNIVRHSVDLASINEFYMDLWKLAEPDTEFKWLAQQVKKGTI